MQIKSKLYLRIILLINYMMEENLCRAVSCKESEREWHMDGPISQVQFLSVFYPDVPHTTLRWVYTTLKTCWMLLAQTIFPEHLILHGVRTTWDGWNLPNKQFLLKSICFSSLLSRVFFVWVYELENNRSLQNVRKKIKK